MLMPSMMREGEAQIAVNTSLPEGGLTERTE